MTRAGIALLVVAAAIGACDRDLVPSPRARHDARDDADARRLADQLAAVPGVLRASVVVHRPYVDPLAAPAAAAAPAALGAAIAVVAMEPARLEPTVQTLAAAALPDLPPAAIRVVVAPPVPPPPALATVGPFEVTAGSATALRATLAAALLAIAALAGLIAYRERWRITRTRSR